MSTAVPLSVVIVGRRSFPRISPANNRQWLPSNTSTPNRTRFRLSSTSEPLPNQVNYAEEMQNGATDSSGSTEKGNEEPVKTHSSNDLMQKLKRYGVAGVLSYGLLNTVYYLTTFLIVWFYVAPAPARMGYAAAVERFLKVMAMVWAGSQVTKLLRVGGALALAPLVDNGLSWFTVKFKFQSKGKAFGTIAGICFALALLLFFGLTLLWA